MKTIAEATIGVQSKNAKGELVRFRVAERGKESFQVSGEHAVTLSDLEDGHPSEMRYELRITHPSALGDAPDEVFRFLDEDSARKAFERYVTVLAKQNLHEPKKLLGAPTVPGRIALDT